MTRRDLLAEAALADIPKILTLQDRNPHSPTYGCFDRNYWHYRVLDYPTGMSQELVWPLALVYSLDLPDNPYRGKAALVDWVAAGIRFAARSSHRDGSCDDYFPFERAGGAASFSLLGMIESYRMLGLADPEMVDFFARRARWLAGFHEAGRLTNHQALIALILDLLGRQLETSEWERARDQRLERILAWQNPEGWFQEYEGFDPGYQTITLSLLAWIDRLESRPELRESLRRGAALAAEMMFPDGSFGGELGSRNTYNYFPHGFELIGQWMPEALATNDRFLAGLERGLGSCYADDHHVGHHVWNYLLAWRDFVPERRAPRARADGRQWLPQAGVLIDRRAGVELYVATGKGGVFRLFRDGDLVVSDTQLSLQVMDGAKSRNAVAHLIGDHEVVVGDDQIVVAGSLAWAKQELMSPLKLLALRVFMLSVGRLFPNRVRRFLQRRLIVGRAAAPFRFVRTFTRAGRGWRVVDEIEAVGEPHVVETGVGSSQTSIYVTMSRTYQRAQLQGWSPVDPAAWESGRLVIERTF